MKRFKLVVAYDGSNYCGWQVQNNGKTIEGELNRCLSELLKEEIVVIGASRTDSGVHARGNVAVFDSETRIPGEKISYALNQRLPDDIVIQSSCEVDKDFHPRYCNTIKTYEYKILNRKFPDPMYRLYADFIHYPLNIEAMQEAANYIVGEHDFKSFCSAGAQVKSTIRTVYSLDVTKDQDDIVRIRITGNGFLYNMVRIIVGTLTRVGLGNGKPEEVEDIMKACDRSKAGPTAPARGLSLIEIQYIEEENKTSMNSAHIEECG